MEKEILDQWKKNLDFVKEAVGKGVELFQEKAHSSLSQVLYPSDEKSDETKSDMESSLKVLKQGKAKRVVFYYPGEEGTYIEDAEVRVFQNGIVHLQSETEETTVHLQNCEIFWNCPRKKDERSKVRLIQPDEKILKEDLNDKDHSEF